MTDFSNTTPDLESRVVYSGVTADDEQVEVVYTETPVDESGGVKDTVAGAAAAVGDTASDAAHVVGDAASDAAHVVGDAASDAARTVGDAATSAAGAVKEAAPSRQQLKQGVSRVAELAQESPFGLAITGACVGFLTGMLIPTTAVDEKIAPYAEQVVDQARVAGHTVVEQSKQAVQEAAPAVGAALSNN